MARTFFLPDTPAEARDAYACFRDHVLTVIGRVRAGITMQDLRRAFHQLDLQPGWIPLTGPVAHGVGFTNFELPEYERPYEATGYFTQIEKDMVLAASNMGLCSKHGWGVRWEDTFVVTEGEPIGLTRDIGM